MYETTVKERFFKNIRLMVLTIGQGMSSQEAFNTTFKNIRIMVLTIGFPCSGSSLCGYLLTAHPNIVIVDEPTVSIKYPGDIKKTDRRKRPKIDVLYEANLPEMFDYILSVDHERWRRALCRESIESPIWRGVRHQRYVHVPNQYQGRCKELKVIGVKRSSINVKVLSNGKILENLKNKLEESNIALKFIFTVRNPYDMIATASQLKQSFINHRIKKCNNFCRYNMRILKQIDTRDVFVSRHEDMVRDSSSQLTKLCDFLQVPISAGYLDDCASQVGELHRSRLKYDWIKNEKHKVASLIKKYDFFQGYEWDS